MVEPTQDEDLTLRVEYLFKLWDDIRWIYRALPKPEKVGPMNLRWVEYPPTRNIVPRLISRAGMQDISPQERAWIVQGLVAWSGAFEQLVVIASLPRDARPYELYSAATQSLIECAEQLRKAVTGLRRDMRNKRRRH